MQAQRVRIGVLSVSFDPVVRRNSGTYSLIVRVARIPGSSPPAAPLMTSAARRSTSLATSGAGDGNRTRMTSLEGW